MIKKEEIKEVLDDYEAHLLENLQKHGPDQSLVITKSWMMLIMGRMIETFTEMIGEYRTLIKLLKERNAKLEEENKELKKRLRKSGKSVS